MTDTSRLASLKTLFIWAPSCLASGGPCEALLIAWLVVTKINWDTPGYAGFCVTLWSVNKVEKNGVNFIYKAASAQVIVGERMYAQPNFPCQQMQVNTELKLLWCLAILDLLLGNRKLNLHWHRFYRNRQFKENQNSFNTSFPVLFFACMQYHLHKLMYSSHKAIEKEKDLGCGWSKRSVFMQHAHFKMFIYQYRFFFMHLYKCVSICKSILKF